MDTITKNVDGDTFNVDDESTRVVGINTPESVHSDESRNTEWGEQASQFAKAMLPSGSETTAHNYGVDHYGRNTSSVSKVVNGVEMDYGLMALDQGYSSYYTLYGKHEDPMLHKQYQEYFTKHAPYQYGNTQGPMAPDDVAEMRQKHQNFESIYSAFQEGTAGQEELDQAAFELYSDPARVVNYRRHLSNWDREVTLEDHDGSARWAHDFFIGRNAKHREEYNRAVQNGHLFLRPKPVLEPSFWEKTKASFGMFNDIANGIEVGELWDAQAVGKEDIGMRMGDLINNVPSQYHADLVSELEEHGQVAAYTKREQLLEDIGNQAMFDNMEWYAQIGYGIPAFLLSPTTVIAGGVIGTAGKTAIKGVRGYTSSKLLTNSALAGTWVLGGATEGVVANFPRLAADHTYTARDYALDIAMDSVAGAGLGVVWHGAVNPTSRAFLDHFGKEAVKARRKEVVEIENKINEDAKRENLPPVERFPTPEAEDLSGSTTGAANRAAKVVKEYIDDSILGAAPTPLQSKQTALKSLEARIEDLRGFKESDGSELGDFNKDGEQVNQPVEGSVEDEISKLHTQRDRIRKEISLLAKSGNSKYVPLEAIDEVKSESFTAVVNTLLKAFPEGSEMHWLLKRHGKLVKSNMDDATREVVDKLNADILKLAANYPTGKIPKGVRKQIRAITHGQRDFKTNNVIGDILTGTTVKAPTKVLADYIKRLEAMDIWDDGDTVPLSEAEFFRRYGTEKSDDIFDLELEGEGELNLGLGADQVPAEVSYLRDLVELNKMARESDDSTMVELVEKLNGLAAARMDQLDAETPNLVRYPDSTESFGASVKMSPREIIEQIKKEGIPFGKGASEHSKKKFRARRKELEQHGRVAVSQDVADVNLIGPKSTIGGDAGVDKIAQPLLPRSFQEVEVTNAYKEPDLTTLTTLRDRLRSDILKPLGLLDVKGKSEKAAQLKRMQAIEAAMNKSPKRVVAHMETLGDVQTAVQVLRVAKTMQAERVRARKIAAESETEGTIPTLTTRELTEELLDPTSPERLELTPKETVAVEAQIEEAVRARTAKSIAKVADEMTNFVASGMKRLNELARKPSSKLDFLGRLQARIVEDLGTSFQNGKLTSLEYIGHTLTEIGKGFGGNARRTHSAALIRDYEYRASAMQILPSYAKTMDAYAISKGEGHIGRSNAQNRAGADDVLVDEFNRDMFKLAEALRRGEDTSKFPPELRGFMDEWDKYMDYNHGRLLDAGIEGFTKSRKVKHYIPRVWEHSAIRTILGESGGRAKLDALFAKAYRTGVDTDGSLGAEEAMKLAVGHVDFLIEQAERARKGETIPDGFEPAIDSRARARRDLDVRVEIDGLSMMDLMDTEMAGIATKYSNRVAGWVGLSKATNGMITSQVDVDVLKANMVAEGLEKGIDTTKYEQYYEDLINLLMGRPTRGGLTTELRQLKDLTALTRMGGLGTAQLIETGQVITRSILDFTSSDDVVREAFKRAGVDPDDSLLIREIQDISKITDDIEWLDRQSVHLDQSEVEEASKARELSLWLADKGTFGSLKAPASRLLGKTTGYNMIRKLQSRVVQSSFTLDVLKHFKDGSGKMGNARLADLGLTNSLGEDEALSKAIREHVKYNADGSIDSINFDKWDVDAREKFQYAMVRDEAQQIQRTLIGELPPWMNKPMMGVLFQFREMPLVAHNKQLGRSLAFADKEAVMGVVANASMAGMVRWAKFAALGAGVTAITGETVSDPTSEQMSVSKYITQFGIYADAYDLVLGDNKLRDVENTKDVGEIALREVPVLGLGKDYYDAFGGADNSKELIDAAQGLTPLGNTALGEMIYTQMLETFGGIDGDREPRKDFTRP